MNILDSFKQLDKLRKESGGHRGGFTSPPMHISKAQVDAYKTEEEAKAYVERLFQKNNVEKMVGGGEAIQNVSFDMIRQARENARAYLMIRDSLLVRKAWDVTPSPIAGLQQYDLEKPAKLLYPVMCPVRNLLPRAQGAGTATNWRGVIGIDPTNIGIGVTTGSRAGVMAQIDFAFTHPYRSIGMENFVTFEAQAAASGFEDLLALAVLQTLQDLMIGEEFMILGGIGNPNEIVGANFQLATPTGMASVVTATGGSGFAATTTYHWVVCPISLDGCSRVTFTAGSPNTTLTTAFPTTITRTNADGTTTIFNGGFGQACADQSFTTTGVTTNSITLSCSAVKNAYGYAWFIGTASGTYTQAVVTNQNTILITANPVGGGNATITGAGLLTANFSANTLVHDGLWTQALGLLSAYINPSSISTNAYFTGTSTQIEQTGSAFIGNYLSLNGANFTSNGASGLTELDNWLQAAFDFYKFSPHVLFVGSAVMQNINNIILNAAGTPLVRFTADMTSERSKGSIVGNAVVTNYVNPFFDAGMGLNIVVHPYLPPCKVLGYTKQLPYQLSNVSVLAQIKARRDYYAQEWPLVKRSYQYGVYSEQTLECYFPPGFQMIDNVGTPSYFSPGIRMPTQTLASNTI